MVFYFASGDHVIYMGKDKYENEKLIAFGQQDDVWFHVDNLSSAHVYLRLRAGESWESIPEDLLKDCAQLTKANSIEGCKKDNVTIIYTPWSNLKKDGSMTDGQVGFHRDKVVRKVFVKTREGPIVNRLNKTKEERHPDLQEEQRQNQVKRQREAKAHWNVQKNIEEKRARELKAIADEKKAGYSSFLTEEAIEATANDRTSDYDPEEDFM
ncbi:hypothetical protein BCR37DRAFT_395720 [Protomyces lactucae-debilis]|uniref:NFACT RNA-binding domain-containing protein n=1 Tax=Protomyces lactucae-debilis TaxID=2754530 RepID=A0A1Y2ETJ2_PROLT|nr:uncharacterized protein BCR37DRAFT_395720 [Protomyces lactucae-debilis]ORY74872.1 hypothetical protein BCR37DRAFT_395720 [Protomyces lactucae-debilis]